METGYQETDDLLEQIRSITKSVELGLRTRKEPPSLEIIGLMGSLYSVMEDLAYALVRDSPDHKPLTDDQIKVAKEAARPYSVLPRMLRLGVRIAETGPRLDTMTYDNYETDEAIYGSGIDVVCFIDSDDEAIVKKLSSALAGLAQYLGSDELTLVESRYGSFWGRWTAKFRAGVTSDYAKDAASKFQRALELKGLDSQQAAIDLQLAEAVTMVIDAFDDVERGCARVGSILLLKFRGSDGLPVMLTRTLSQREMIAIEKFPEIQMRPDTALQSLAAAVDSLNDETGSTQQLMQ